MKTGFRPELASSIRFNPLDQLNPLEILPNLELLNFAVAP